MKLHQLTADTLIKETETKNHLSGIFLPLDTSYILFLLFLKPCKDSSISCGLIEVSSDKNLKKILCIKRMTDSIITEFRRKTDSLHVKERNN